MNIEKFSHFPKKKETLSFYNKDTLKPILNYDPEVVDNYPNNKIEAIKTIFIKYKSSFSDAKDKVEKQWESLSKEKDPKREKKYRFTPDHRLIDRDNYLTWKVELVPEEIIPVSLKKFIHCPIFFTIDDRENKFKDNSDIAGVWAGDLYIPYLDIVIVSPFRTNSNYWKTILAHEIAHSVLHKGIEEGSKQIEGEADQFVRDNFEKEEWFDEEVLHGGS